MRESASGKGGYGSSESAPVSLLRLQPSAPPYAGSGVATGVLDHYDPAFVKRMEAEGNAVLPASVRAFAPLPVESDVAAKSAFENLRQQKKGVAGDSKATARVRANLKKQMDKETDKQLTAFVARGKASVVDASEQAAREEVFRLAKAISDVKKSDPERAEKLRNLMDQFSNALAPLQGPLVHVGVLRQKRIALKGGGETADVKHQASCQKTIDKTAAVARSLHKQAPKPGWFGGKRAR